MNTKQLIKELNEGVVLAKIERKEIIELLQQGEKYKQMYLWSGNLCEELKKELKEIKRNGQ